MKYLVFALYQEARFYIDLYKAKKSSDYEFIDVYETNQIKILIIGVGVLNAIKKISRFFSMEKINKNLDKVFNIGICGSNNYEIGEVFLINKINYHNFSLYPDLIGNFNLKEEVLNSVDKVSNDYNISDMEGYGVYYALSDFFYLDNIYIIKIVSDNKQKEVKIDNTLILSLMENSYLKIKELLLEKENKECINEFKSMLLDSYPFTKTMKIELEKYLKYLYYNQNDKFYLLEEKYSNLEIKSKDELKRLFNEIKGDIDV